MKKRFRTYESARIFARKLKLKNRKGWKEFKKTNQLPENIPKDPQSAYKNKGWISWGDFLGTGNIRLTDSTFKTFQEARKFAQSLKLKNVEAWRNFLKLKNKPKDIPSDPRNAYMNKGWKGWGDFLGTGTIAPFNIKFRQFLEAREYIHSLRLQSQNEWNKYRSSGKKPKDIPSNPFEAYGKEWTNWGDFLGTGFIAFQNRNFLSYDDAKKIVRSLKLKNRNEWQQFCDSGKKPMNIPADPHYVYKNKEWKSMGDWLGTGTIAPMIIAKNWLPYNEAKIEYRKIAKKYGLKNQRDWIRYSKEHKLPKGLTKYPWEIYTKERILKGRKK